MKISMKLMATRTVLFLVLLPARLVQASKGNVPEAVQEVSLAQLGAAHKLQPELVLHHHNSSRNRLVELRSKRRHERIDNSKAHLGRERIGLLMSGHALKRKRQPIDAARNPEKAVNDAKNVVYEADKALDDLENAAVNAEVQGVQLPPVKPPPISVADYCGDEDEAQDCRYTRDQIIEVKVGYKEEEMWYRASVIDANTADKTFTIRFLDGRLEYGVPCSSTRITEGGYRAMQWVEAKWKGYGRWYTSQVTAVNADGTYNVMYKDGVVETNVLDHHIRHIEGAVGPEIEVKKDPVCKISNNVKNMQDNIDDAHKEIQRFLNFERGSDALNAAQMGPPRYQTSQEMDNEAEVDQYVGVGSSMVTTLAPAPAVASAPDAMPKATEVPDDSADGESDEEEAQDQPDLELLRQKILALRQEILGRTDELLQRGKALGEFVYDIDELLFLQEQDQLRLTEPMPLTAEDMLKEIKELEDIIKDRAKRLSELLEVEHELREQEGTPAISKNMMKKLVGEVERRLSRIGDTVGVLFNKTDSLDADGLLDEELFHEVIRFKGDVGNLVREAGRFDSLLQKLHNNDISVEAAKALLTKDLFDVDMDLQVMRVDSEGFGMGVLPTGKKWWRYRWEYSFVEAMVVCMCCAIAAFWQMALMACMRHLREKMANAPLQEGASELGTATASLETWMHQTKLILSVLLLTVISMWTLARVGIYHIWVPLQFMIIKGTNLPSDGNAYVYLAFNVVMQLSFAMIMFFLLILMICYKAARNDHDCCNLEENNMDVLDQYPVSQNMIGGIAPTPAAFAKLKREWFRAVLERWRNPDTPRNVRDQAKTVVEALAARGIVDMSQLDAEPGDSDQLFKLWFFFSHRIREGIDAIFKLDSIIWVLLFVTFPFSD